MSGLESAGNVPTADAAVKEVDDLLIGAATLLQVVKEKMARAEVYSKPNYKGLVVAKEAVEDAIRDFSELSYTRGQSDSTIPEEARRSARAKKLMALKAARLALQKELDAHPELSEPVVDPQLKEDEPSQGEDGAK